MGNQHTLDNYYCKFGPKAAHSFYLPAPLSCPLTCFNFQATPKTGNLHEKTDLDKVSIFRDSVMPEYQLGVAIILTFVAMQRNEVTSECYPEATELLDMRRMKISPKGSVFNFVLVSEFTQLCSFGLLNWPHV